MTIDNVSGGELIDPAWGNAVADFLNDYEPYTDYTPGLINGTLGNGTLSFRYARWQSRVHVRGQFTLGSTSSVGTNFAFDFPTGLGAETVPIALGVSWLRDASGTDQMGTCYTSSGISVWTSALSAVSATNPFTWTTSDIINVDLYYETNFS